MSRMSPVLALALLTTVVGLTAGGCGSAIDAQANEHFKTVVGKTSVTVFPAFLRLGKNAGYDPDSADAIAARWKELGLGDASVSAAKVPITGQWSFNQAAMWKASAAEFGQYIKDHPIDTEYALLPEYLFLARSDGNPGDVGGVHWFLVDREGKLVEGGLSNDHHPEYKQVMPKNTADCRKVALATLDVTLTPYLPKP